MRRKLIAGNWKMHGSGALVDDLVPACCTVAAAHPSVEVALFPPAVYLTQAVALLSAGVRVGAQDVHSSDEGAFTGDVAAPMLADVGCAYVIVGHSERRALHHETDADVVAKAQAASAAGVVPIVCVGESLADREAVRAERVIQQQLAALAPMLRQDPDLVIAYEPVWAIGTGRSAEPGQVQDMHRLIRASLAEENADIAAATRILYGGSVKPSNGAALLQCDDVDGALIGGASLSAEAFGKLIAIADAPWKPFS